MGIEGMYYDTVNVERFTGLNICSFRPMKFFTGILSIHGALASSAYKFSWKSSVVFLKTARV